MTKVLKWLGGLSLAGLALFAFVVTFSSHTTRWECAGSIASKGKSQDATIYMRLEQYRWWVGLWSESKGSLWLEIPNEVIEYYEHIQNVGDERHIYSPKDERKGSFSLLSKSLALSTFHGFFDGKCKRND